MEKLPLKNSSPTLVGEMIQAKIKEIRQACNLFRCKNAQLSINVTYSDNSHQPEEILLSELPEELRKGFHDYATRLIAERHQLERQLQKLKEPCTNAQAV